MNAKQIMRELLQLAALELQRGRADLAAYYSARAARLLASCS